MSRIIVCVIFASFMFSFVSMLMATNKYKFNPSASVVLPRLTNKRPPSSPVFKDNLLKHRHRIVERNGKKTNVRIEWDSDYVWESLLEEGAALSARSGSGLVVVEVGMHSAKQCLAAAELGFEAHCVEPSPPSFRRVQQQIRDQASPAARRRITTYHVAAGASGGGTLPFTASGGTGDHAGGHDMWAMTEAAAPGGTAEVIDVPAAALDDLVPAGEGVFLAKIDTQGFEPEILRGWGRALSSRRVRHVLFEYWPRGIDLLGGTPGQCAAVHMLESLVRAGYTLYALSVQSHPKAPVNDYDRIVIRERYSARPLNTFRDNCKWYFDLEKDFPSETYKMGYWTDILAVAEDNSQQKLIGVTDVGKAL